MKHLLTLNLSIMFALATMMSFAGCADVPQGDDGSPRVIEIHTQDLTVGETLYMYGVNFSQESFQTNKVYFEGIYFDDLGHQDPVSLALTPLYDGEVELNGQILQRLRINRIGPFENPFSTHGRPGVFKGKITAVIEDDNGYEYTDLQAQSFELNVGPSIHITEFQPIFADCGEPAIRALQGIAYRLRVEVSGLEAVRFVYKFNKVNGSESVTEYEHDYGDAATTEDVVGDVEPIFFNVIPDQNQYTVSSIRVLAYDRDNNVVETALPITVHRPIEIVSEGNGREMAQLYKPVPVSGCSPGSVGTRVNYTENKSEYRQRTVNMTVSQNWVRNQGQNLSRTWLEGVSEGQSQSRSLGSSTSEEEQLSESMNLNYNRNEANNVNFSSNDGETWNWSISEGEGDTSYEERMSDIYGSGSFRTTVKATAEGSLPFIAKASGSVATSVGVTAGGRTGNTEGQSVSNSSERGYSTGGTANQGRNFGSSTSEGRGQSMNNSYALGNINSSSANETEGVSSNRTWNLSENESTSEVISTSDTVAESLTVSDSSTETTTQSFSGFIPRGQFGIFYRQTTRWVRRAEVRSLNQCGVSQHIGELQFNEYTWAPDLAISEICEERPPEPNLPAADCFIPPCGG